MRIGIVGSGMVGSTGAYALIMQGIGRDIVLVDKDTQRAEAEAKDLLHAVPFSNPLRVRSGDYSDLKGSRVVVISAGVAQKPGESRLDLLRRNAAVFQEVVPGILEHAPHAILVVATNPVDIMTHLTARYAADFGVPKSRVIGTGTTLDTARFRSLLGNHLGVDSQHIHAYVIGEHGDSEVLTWSLVNVGSMPLQAFCSQQRIQLDDAIRSDIDDRVRNAAYSIIQGKGATYYGIGSAIAKIAGVVLYDQRSILTVSSPSEIADVREVSLSLPHLVGGEGIITTFPPPLDDQETRALENSARIIREAINQLDRSED